MAEVGRRALPGCLRSRPCPARTTRVQGPVRTTRMLTIPCRQCPGALCAGRPRLKGHLDARVNPLVMESTRRNGMTDQPVTEGPIDLPNHNARRLKGRLDARPQPARGDDPCIRAFEGKPFAGAGEDYPHSLSESRIGRVLLDAACHGLYCLGHRASCHESLLSDSAGGIRQ